MLQSGTLKNVNLQNSELGDEGAMLLATMLTAKLQTNLQVSEGFCDAMGMLSRLIVWGPISRRSIWSIRGPDENRPALRNLQNICHTVASANVI